MTESCPLDWCEHDADHVMPHRGTVITVPGQHTATIVVTVESSAHDGSEPMPVVLVRDGDLFAFVHLEWGYLHALATAANTASWVITRVPASAATTH